MDLKNFIIQNYDKKRKWMQRCMMDDRKSLAAICTSKEFGSVELRNMLTDIRHVLTVGRVGGVMICILLFQSSYQMTSWCIFY